MRSVSSTPNPLRPLFGRVLVAACLLLGAQAAVALLGPAAAPSSPWLTWCAYALATLPAFLAAVGIVAVHSFRAAVRQRALSEGLLETMTDGVVVTDHRGTIRSCNAAVEATFGYTARELVGRNVKVLVPPPFDEQHDETLRRAIREDRLGPLAARRETVGQRKDGSIVPVDLAVREMRAGRDRWYIAVVSDVTERKRVSQRLQEAKQAADAASHAKSEFLANMSHEIRTPMTAILGFTDLLRKGGQGIEETDRQDYLNTIHTSGRHLLDLINDILDLSKIEAGQMTFERIAFSPAQLIAEVVSVLRVRAHEKGLFLECEWRGKVPETVCSDPARLRQMLINLAGNAVKFTHAGGVRIVAELVTAGARPQLAIEVIDTGIGIAADKLESIFDPFVQADTSVTREFGGTGLGLSICRRIVESLGGELTVRSRPGEGSTFTATIDTGPLDDVRLLDSPPSGEVRSQDAPAEPRNATLPPARILLVDDGDTNRKLIGLVLRRAGAQVVEAENGRVAVELATGSPFDVVLMDMQMPVMDGYSATRELRRLGLGTPIIALTAHAMKGDESKCLAAGCSGYLTKPIDTDLLLDAVAGAVGATGPRAAATEAPARERPPERSAIVSTFPMDDPDFREIAAEFAQRLQEKLAAMRLACDRDALEDLAELAHWLKGAGGTAGFPAFTGPARRLEQQAKDRARDRIPPSILEIADLAGRIAVPTSATVGAIAMAGATLAEGLAPSAPTPHGPG